MEFSLSASYLVELKKIQHNVVGTPCYVKMTCVLMFAQGLSTILQQKDTSSVVYCADGVHPTHNSRSTYAWIEKGGDLEQFTENEHNYININRLPTTHQAADIIALDQERINAQSTKGLYQVALEKHPEAECIYIISDNARYYRNKKLTERVSVTKIKQIFLQPYSPNLNLIERLWKFLRKKVINTGFYQTKEKFRKAVKSFFEDIAIYKTELEALLTLNFHLANSQSISF